MSKQEQVLQIVQEVFSQPDIVFVKVAIEKIATLIPLYEQDEREKYRIVDGILTQVLEEYLRTRDKSIVLGVLPAIFAICGDKKPSEYLSTIDWQLVRK